MPLLSTCLFKWYSTQFTKGCIPHSSQVRKFSMQWALLVYLLLVGVEWAYLSHNAPGTYYRFPPGRNLPHLLHKAQDLWIEAPVQPLQPHLHFHFFWKDCWKKGNKSGKKLPKHIWKMIVQPLSGLLYFTTYIFLQYLLFYSFSVYHLFSFAKST